MAENNSKSTNGEPKVTRAARKAEKRRAAEELRRRRTGQLENAKVAVERLEKALNAFENDAVRHKALSSHLQGFYDEIDKLTKSKALVEATDLVVQQSNYIVQDAKELIKGDVHLDRIKEFVPAGTNPEYRDVLLVLRTIQQSLARCETQSEGRKKNLSSKLRGAKTISAALQCYLDGKEDSVPSKAEIQAVIGGSVSGECLAEYEDGNDYFDFEKLDRHDLDSYLAENEGHKDLPL